jgi:hypothetical protein
MRFLLILAAALACASPAEAQKATAEEVSAEALSAEMVAYGQWLTRADQIQAPLMTALQAMQPRWQAAMATRDRRAAIAAFRPFIGETVELIGRINAQLDALPTPEFPALDLAADVQPRALVRDMRRLNEQFRTFVESYGPLLDAMVRNDVAAVQRAGGQMIGGVRLIFDSQILLTRAGLAATAREESSWEMQNVQFLYFSAGARIVDAWPRNHIAGIDRALAADLRDFATQIDATATEGSAKFEAELAEYRDMLAEFESDGDASSAAVMRRRIAVFEVDRAIFPMAQELSAILRDHATRFADGRITVEAISGAFVDLQRIRSRIDAIVTEEAAALSRSD